MAHEVMQGFPVPRGKRIPRSDWDRPPWNRWSFQHVREVLPTTEVWRGSGPIWKLPQASQKLHDVSFTDSGNNRTNVADWLATSFSDGIAVLHRGALVYEKYFNGMTSRTPHLSQSIAKSITSAVAGILVNKGLLDPEEPVTRYLPELKSTAWRDAELRHSLDMVSGVKYVEDYEASDADIAMTDIASGWKPPRAGTNAPPCIWDQILTLTRQVREHGAQFEYRSIEADVLAHCMERVTQTKLSQLISAELWQPLGAEESACFTVDAAGYALADGGFNATLRDYARFGQMLACEGRGNGRRIVPEAWIRDTLDCHPDLFGPPYSDILPNGAYRNQFWIRDANREVLMARGVFGQLIYVDIASEFVVVKLSSWPEFLSAARRLDELAAIDAIHAHLMKNEQ